MPFNELVRGQQLPDPKAREAEDIKRSVKKSKRRVRKTSVSLGTVRKTVVFLTLVFGAALVCGMGYLIYIGFQTYING